MLKPTVCLFYFISDVVDPTLGNQIGEVAPRLVFPTLTSVGLSFAY